MQLIRTPPDFHPARRDLEMFLTRAMRLCDSGFQALCVQVQTPRDAIVFGQTEAPVSRHDKDLQSGVTRQTIVRNRTLSITPSAG
jgi:hypothetical protein